MIDLHLHEQLQAGDVVADGATGDDGEVAVDVWLLLVVLVVHGGCPFT